MKLFDDTLDFSFKPRFDKKFDEPIFKPEPIKLDLDRFEPKPIYSDLYDRNNPNSYVTMGGAPHMVERPLPPPEMLDH